MDKSKVSVIISLCVGTGEERRVTGPREETSHDNVIAANLYADDKRAPGVSVLVRPNYNQHDDKGTYFKEWRSFDGEPFKEVIFRVDN